MRFKNGLVDENVLVVLIQFINQAAINFPAGVDRFNSLFNLALGKGNLMVKFKGIRVIGCSLAFETS